MTKLVHDPLSMVSQPPGAAIHRALLAAFFDLMRCVLGYARFKGAVSTNIQLGVCIDSLFTDMSDTNPKSPSSNPADDKSIASVDRGDRGALSHYDPDEIKRAWRKVDLHVMPVAFLLYLSSYIDRSVPSLQIMIHLVNNLSV